MNKAPRTKKSTASNCTTRWTLALATCTLALVSFGFAGCAGYQMGAIKPAAYANIHKIAVPTFENRTLEPRIAVLVTNSVIKQIQLDGTFEVATSENADAVLRGVISRVERQQLRAARTDTFLTTEQLTYLVIQWALYDPVTGDKLEYSQATDVNENNVEDTSGLKNRPGQIIGRTIVFLDENFQSSERGAIPVAAQKAAEQLVSQLSEGW